MKTLKHLFTALLLMVATVAKAHDFEVGGIYYAIISSTNKTVEVTFNGNYSDEYRGNVVIPKNVTYNNETYNITSIGDYAFKSCGKLTSVTIPNSVTSIGYIAFYGCSGLTSITIPNSVTNIENGAFQGCTGLKEVHISDLAAWCGIDFENYGSNPLYYAHNLYLNGELVTELVIPDGVNEIKGRAFSYCTGLTSVTIGNSVTSIGYYAFDGCAGLTSVTIPNSVTSIGGNAFSDCTGLTSITIPNSVISIEGMAFLGCTDLTSITIPNSVRNIGNYAFKGCTGLTNIVVNEGNSTYDSRDNCNAIIETATNKLIVGCRNTLIPNSVTSIGSYAFYHCTGLTSITIPNSVNSIGEDAFIGCRGLTRVDIVDGVKSIGYSAFASCSNLEELYLSNTIESIGTYAFRGCTNIFEIKVGSKKAITCNENIFSEDVYNNALLYVPEGCKFAYKKTVPWNRFYIVEIDFTDISGVKEQIAESKTVYDLQGRKVENPTNGIYIVNGKKAFLK